MVGFKYVINYNNFDEILWFNIYTVFCSEFNMNKVNFLNCFFILYNLILILLQYCLYQEL